MITFSPYSVNNSNNNNDVDNNDNNIVAISQRRHLGNNSISKVIFSRYFLKNFIYNDVWSILYYQQ